MQKTLTRKQMGQSKNMDGSFRGDRWTDGWNPKPVKKTAVLRTRVDIPVPNLKQIKLPFFSALTNIMLCLPYIHRTPDQGSSTISKQIFDVSFG